MRKLKKIMCLFLSVLMFLSMCTPTFAVDNTTNSTSTNETQKTVTNTETNSPLKIEISTNKEKYSVLEVAKITAKVTNISSEDIKNVSAETVFNDLSPVSRNKSKTKKEVETLKAGESISFTYKATLNVNEHKLNFIQKILLWFVRLFNGGYTVSDNGFDNGRDYTEITDTISFGKFDAVNTVRVWYGKNSTINTDKSYQDLIKDVDIDKTYEYNENNISYDDKTGIRYVNNIIVIMFDDECTNERKAEIINSINGSVVGGTEAYDELYIEIKKSTLEELELICNKLNEVDGIMEASYDELYERSLNSTSYVPNDPWKAKDDTDTERIVSWDKKILTTSVSSAYVNNCWALEVDANKAWKYNKYFKTINIGIADSGFDSKHEDLRIQIVSEENSVEDNHGTHVAGIIGAIADNNIGITGIVHNNFLFGYDLTNSNKIFVSKTEDYKAIETLVKDYKCKVINYSFGNNIYENSNTFYLDKEFKNQVTQDKINGWGNEASKRLCKLLGKGYDFVVVQAAGNGSKNLGLGIDAIYNGAFCSITKENCYSSKKISVNDIMDRVIVVAATQGLKGFEEESDYNYNITNFSNGGNQVSIAAPGYGVYSTVAGIKDERIESGQQYGCLGGTSMAAPIVAGVAGLVWSVNEDFSGADVKKIVCNSTNVVAKDDESSTHATGNFKLVNAYLSVKEAVKRTYGDTLYTVSGKVIDSTTNEPISNVSIEAIDNNSENNNVVAITSTNENGEFDIPLHDGSYSLSFNHENYEYYGESVDVEGIDVILPDTVMLIPKDTRIVTDSGTCGENVNWTLYDDGELVISGEGEMNNYSMTFSSPWISRNYGTRINRINIKSNIINIGNYAFSGLTNLNNVVIPNSVTCIGVGAFLGCKNLTDIIIPDSVSTIDSRAFSSTNLISVMIPDSVINIGGGVFYNCTSLKSIELSKNITSYKKEYAFSTGGKDYYWGFFENCENLESIFIPDNIIDISCAFRGCKNLKDVIISNSVVDISYAFSNCINLENVTIPSSVTNTDYAFAGCTNLKFVNIESGVESIGTSAFSSCSVLQRIKLPNSVTKIGSYAFSCCNEIESIRIPESVEYIGNNAFNSCTNLSNINLLDGLIEIGSHSFDGCEKIKEIKLPDTLKVLGSGAFRGTSIQEITIPKSIIKMNSRNNYGECDSALYGAQGLKKVIFEQGLISIPNYALNGCWQEMEVIMPNTVTTIGANAFWESPYINIVDFPNSLQSIGAYALQGNRTIKEINIPNNVTYIGEGAFSSCSELTSIKLSDSLTSISKGLFSGCSNLTNISIPNSITAIGQSAFEICKKLTNIILPNSLNTIGACAFYSSGIGRIEIPKSVTRINGNAFYSCDNLQSITIKNPNCYIETNANATLSDTATIYGYANSTAQAYAEKYNRPFVSLD